MKQAFAATAAALLLAACDTYPPGDPYGAPYPPQDPYGTPYPPDPYPPPGSYPPPGAYPPGATGPCPILSSRDWRAWVDLTPNTGERPTLFVTGTIVAPTAGYRMEFEPYLQERRSYPVEVTAKLHPIPPPGGAAQAITTHDVRWQWPLQSGPVGSVTIECGQQTLARISPVAAQQ